MPLLVELRYMLCYIYYKGVNVKSDSVSIFYLSFPVVVQQTQKQIDGEVI